MFIMAKRNIELPSNDGSQKHKVAKGFIGNIPDWAAETAYFRALVSDGKIVIPASQKDKDITDTEGKDGSKKRRQSTPKKPPEEGAVPDEDPPTKDETPTKETE